MKRKPKNLSPMNLNLELGVDYILVENANYSQYGIKIIRGKFADTIFVYDKVEIKETGIFKNKPALSYSASVIQSPWKGDIETNKEFQSLTGEILINNLLNASGKTNTKSTDTQSGILSESDSAH